MKTLDVGDIVKVNIDRKKHETENPYLNVYSGMSNGKHGFVRAIYDEFYQVEYWDCSCKRKDWYMLEELIKLEEHDFINYNFTYRQDEFRLAFDRFPTLKELGEFQHDRLDEFLGLTYD